MRELINNSPAGRLEWLLPYGHRQGIDVVHGCRTAQQFFSDVVQPEARFHVVCSAFSAARAGPTSKARLLPTSNRQVELSSCRNRCRAEVSMTLYRHDEFSTRPAGTMSFRILTHLDLGVGGSFDATPAPA
jgi:hypothetical protein